ncbi:MAG: 4Fe-4S dicluster domain-containing protein [Chloroflexi bacterium]|nr:4Fe-4S dicluster domain-containing protein [Chloroflexota bacterium]
MASKHSNWPNPAEAPALDDLAKCVHCGLCVNSCPTYAVTGLEVESPRGRIYLARAVEEGRIELTAAVQGHWDLCLQCRACEAVCPSGVPYGRIMEHARAQLDTAASTGRGGRRLRKFLLRRVLARPRILAAAVTPVRWLANSPLRGIGRRTRLLRLGPALARGEAQLPRHIGKPLRAGDSLPAVLGASETAVLFTGCVMGEVFGDVHRATARVLARQGVAAIASAGQGCCGALHAHAGDLAFARELARRNIDALAGTAPAPIVVNSAGCGAAMKEYGDILSGDTAYAARAREFAARVRDFTEYAAALAEQPAASFPARVTYQDPCHLAHAQRIREQPRNLLRTIDGCDLVETPGADLCCGAAGLYSLVQPAMSAELRSRKASQFRDAAPDVIVTANPGCQLQYEAAVREAGITARVMHIAELLDEAQSAAADSS